MANCRHSSARLLQDDHDCPGLPALCARHHPAQARHAPRRAGRGKSIELELWALSAAAFGKFVAAIPPPLSIGTIRLADGRGVKGFIVEPAAITGARDISAFGGWRAFMTEKAAV